MRYVPFLAAALACAVAAGTTSTAAGVPMHAERARAAAGFVDSIGVNVHLSYRDGPYGRFPAVAGLLRGLGVRHVRDGVTLGQTDVCREDRALAAAGMRFTYITQASLNAGSLAAWAACVGPAIEAYEGLNEFDIQHPASDADWAGTVQRAQRALYRDVKADPALARLDVIGPSLTSEGAYRAVGDLSGALDQANMHDYFAGHEPGTGGWGAGGYGSIAYNLRAAQQVAAKPVVATETGYATLPGQHGVDAATQAKYLTRMFLEQFAAGVPRTFAYELVDEGGPPFGSFGLVGTDLAPKPAYTQLAGLIALLRDAPSDAGTAGAAPASLTYALAGGGPALHHVLLAKRDGRFELALWIEAAGYDPDARAPLAVAPQAVALDVRTPLRAATLYAYGAGDRLEPEPLRAHGPLHVTVTDRVSVLELVPARSATR